MSQVSSLRLNPFRQVLLLAHITLGQRILYPTLFLKAVELLSFENLIDTGQLDLVFSLFMLVSSVLLAWPLFQKSWFRFFNHPFKNLKAVLIFFPLLILVSLILGYVISSVSGMITSNNQAMLTDYFKETPYILIFQALIFAPIYEELVFRGFIYGSLERANKPLAFLISSLFFGLAHMVASSNGFTWTDLWFLPQYSLMGYVLARPYDRSGTLMVPILVHFCNNALGLIALSL